MTWLRTWGLVGAVAAMTTLAGCGDSKSSSASDSAANSESQGTTQSTATDSTGTMSGSMSETEPTDGGSGSASMTGTTDQSGSMSDSNTMGGGSSDTVSGTGTTGQDSQGGSGGSTTTGEVPGTTTGEPVDCEAAMTKEDCLALGCMPIEGQAFEFDGAIWCLNETPSFLGCIAEMACDAVITTMCKGQNTYQLPSGCAPGGYKSCEPPPDPGMDGYPPC